MVVLVRTVEALLLVLGVYDVGVVGAIGDCVCVMVRLVVGCVDVRGVVGAVSVFGCYRYRPVLRVWPEALVLLLVCVCVLWVLVWWQWHPLQPFLRRLACLFRLACPWF